MWLARLCTLWRVPEHGEYTDHSRVEKWLRSVKKVESEQLNNYKSLPSGLYLFGSIDQLIFYLFFLN